MLVLFPNQPDTLDVDSSFREEARAAEKAGFEVALVDEGELTFEGKIRLLGLPSTPGPALYPVSLLTPRPYGRLQSNLEDRDSELLTSLDAYVHAYHFPEWYRAIDPTQLTPRSIWIPGQSFDLDQVATAVKGAFGSPALV